MLVHIVHVTLTSIMRLPTVMVYLVQMPTICKYKERIGGLVSMESFLCRAQIKE